MAYHQRFNPPPPERLARLVTHRFQTYDFRKFLFNDAVARAETAIARAGGEQLGGQIGLRRHIKRWTVLRSPHVNKTSREKFWMVNHRRIVRWQAGPAVARDAAVEIARGMPPHVAVRTIEETPGLWALEPLFEVIEAAREGRPIGTPSVVDAAADHAANGEGGKGENDAVAATETERETPAVEDEPSTTSSDDAASQGGAVGDEDPKAQQ